VTGQERAIGNDDVVAQSTVVRDVTMRHEKVVRPDQRVLVAAIGAVHRDMLAENVVIADAQPCGRALVLEVLRRITDDAACVKRIVRADRRQACKKDVRSDDACRADCHALVDDRIGADCDGRIQLRARMNDGGGVDHGAASSHAVAALSSQCQRLSADVRAGCAAVAAA